MSNYFVGSPLSSDGQLWAAVHELKRRVDALEAAQKPAKPPTPRRVKMQMEAKPAPTQREPGWYWVRWQKHGEWIASNLGKNLMGHLVWWPILGEHRDPIQIGPRIQEPEE